MADVDLYCERLGPGLLAEPVNAATNLAFIVASLILWRQCHKATALCIEIRVLISLIITIGIGSGLFHTFATSWARVLDVVPILVFQLMFVWFYTRREMGWHSLPAGITVFLVLVATLTARLFPHLLNGSLPYVPTLAVLLALGTYHWSSRKPKPLSLLVAGALFSVALLFRILDAVVCSQFPLGTHFLWHLTNAVVLYLCASTFIGTRRIKV